MTIDNLIAVGTLVFLEGILSADNALVLALLVRPLPTELQRRALLYGLAGAFAFRGLAILAAQWVIEIWWLQGLGALYLAYLGVAHFVRHHTLHHHEVRQAPRSFWRTVATVELTDIAFALDAVLVAVALSDQLWVIWTGAIIGMVAMRFAAGFFVNLLHRFPQVENMAYILVGWISIKLLFATFETFSAAVLQHPYPEHILPSWLFWMVMGLIVLLGGWYAYRHPGEAARAPQEFPPAEELPEGIRATIRSLSRWRLPNVVPVLRREWPLVLSIFTTALFLVFGQRWLADLSSRPWFTFVLAWLFTVILFSAFAVVRHADSLAVRLGEPLGTLVLTLSVTGIEVMMIAAVMYAGSGHSSLARDAMFAVVMIVLNGMVGLSLSLGGLRYHEQTYNLQGANAFLALIVPLAVLGLVLPTFTVSSPGPTFSPLQATFLILMSVGLYGVFLAIQTSRHRDYFSSPNSVEAAPEHQNTEESSGFEVRSFTYHASLLLAYLLPLVTLSKQLAAPINYGIRELHAPPTLGGFLVAVLILSPESLSATRAALANQLQRSVNILLRSVLATISLTIPAVLSIGLMTGQTVILGLDAVDMILLLLTLGLSMLTFASARTNVLLGAVHLLLFLAYLMLIFEK